MIIETKSRSLAKAISWRVFATLTTMTIVYIIFGNLKLAGVVGGFEVIAKIFVYFIHERMWNKIKFGKKEIDPFVIWITGLPLSGKTTVGDGVAERLKKLGLKVERLDGRDIRKLFPKVGFTREERIQHNERVAHLASILEKNGICVVASFVSPYEEMRQFARRVCKNFVEVYLKCDVETCEKRDKEGLYEKARRGEIKNFTGISDPYEEPVNPEITIDVRKTSPDEAVSQVVNYVKRRFLK